MVYKPVLLINLENEQVVDVVCLEHLHSNTSRSEKEYEHKAEIVYFNTRRELLPMIFVLTLPFLWRNQEQEDG